MSTSITAMWHCKLCAADLRIMRHANRTSTSATRPRRHFHVSAGVAASSSDSNHESRALQRALSRTLPGISMDQEQSALARLIGAPSWDEAAIAAAMGAAAAEAISEAAATPPPYLKAEPPAEPRTLSEMEADRKLAKRRAAACAWAQPWVTARQRELSVCAQARLLHGGSGSFSEEQQQAGLARLLCLSSWDEAVAANGSTHDSGVAAAAALNNVVPVSPPCARSSVRGGEGGTACGARPVQRTNGMLLRECRDGSCVLSWDEETPYLV